MQPLEKCSTEPEYVDFPLDALTTKNNHYHCVTDRDTSSGLVTEEEIATHEEYRKVLLLKESLNTTGNVMTETCCYAPESSLRKKAQFYFPVS